MTCLKIIQSYVSLHDNPWYSQIATLTETIADRLPWTQINKSITNNTKLYQVLRNSSTIS